MMDSNNKFFKFIKKSFHDVFKYFAGRLLASLIIGVCVFAVLTIIGTPLPWLFGLLAGLGNIIPTIGPIIVYAISALILIFLEPVQVLYLLFVTVGSQLLDGFVLNPIITGKSTQIKPIIVIILIMVGGSIFGIPGVLLAVPAAIIVRVFYSVFIKNKDISDKE